MDNSMPDATDNFGLCTLLRFKLCRDAGVLLLSAHGGAGYINAVWASSESKVQEWIDSQGGEGGPSRICTVHNIQTDWWTACVYSLWLSETWKPCLNRNKSIVIILSCVAACCSGSDESCLGAAGGRVGFGYDAGCDTDESEDDLALLFGRMNGTLDGAAKRTAGKAYGDGAGYTEHFVMVHNQPATDATYAWTVLCPSPNAVFPSENSPPPRGGGCIIFDTYMDPFYVANDAVVPESGSQPLSDRRWFGDPIGQYLVSFDFNKRIGGFITMRAVAAKCLSLQRLGLGLGQRMDGDRVKPNEDDRLWGF
jgi:hypothetical protein